MIGIPWWGYAAAFLSSTVLALALTPVARQVAIRLQVLDHPGDYKQQKTPIPYLGGVAIVAAFTMVVVVATWLVPAVPWQEPTLILGLSLALALVGLADDLRNLSPWTRLLSQVVAASVLVTAGTHVQAFSSMTLNSFVTVLWVVGVTNAFNLLDNMDGLSAGVTSIAAGSFFGIAALNGQYLVAALAIALAGVGVGFLWHNFHPATIYMGDAGSLFFGFLIAVLGLKLRFDAPVAVTFLVPIVVVGVALLDTTLVTITRIANGKNPLSGGRDHVSHRLTRLGLSVRGAVAAIYAAAIGCGILAGLMSRMDRAVAYAWAGALAVLSLVGLVLLVRVRVYEGERESPHAPDSILGPAEAS